MTVQYINDLQLSFSDNERNMLIVVARQAFDDGPYPDADSIMHFAAQPIIDWIENEPKITTQYVALAEKMKAALPPVDVMQMLNKAIGDRWGEQEIIESAHDVVYGWWENEAPECFTEPTTNTEVYEGVSCYSQDGNWALHFYHFTDESRWIVQAQGYTDDDLLLEARIDPQSFDNLTDFQHTLRALFEAGSLLIWQRQ